MKETKIKNSQNGPQYFPALNRVAERGQKELVTMRTPKKLPSGFSMQDYHLNLFETDILSLMSLPTLCKSLGEKENL